MSKLTITLEEAQEIMDQLHRAHELLTNIGNTVGAAAVALRISHYDYLIEQFEEDNQ